MQRGLRKIALEKLATGPLAVSPTLAPAQQRQTVARGGKAIGGKAISVKAVRPRIQYPDASNNPGNMRGYKSVKWYGANPVTQEGKFLTFKSPYLGFRAMVRNLMNIGNDRTRTKAFTPREVATIYAPKSENDHDSYFKNFERATKLNPDQVINSNDDGQMVDYALGVVGAESGDKALQFFKQDLPAVTNAVRSARKSL